MITLLVFDKDNDYCSLIEIFARNQETGELQVISLSDETKLDQVLGEYAVNAALVHCERDGSVRQVAQKLRSRKIPFGFMTSDIDPETQLMGAEFESKIFDKRYLMSKQLIETVNSFMFPQEGGGRPEIV